MRSFSPVTNASRARATAGKSRRTAATKSSNSFVPFSPRKDGEPEGSNPSRNAMHSFSNARASRVSPKCCLAVDRKKKHGAAVRHDRLQFLYDGNLLADLGSISRLRQHALDLLLFVFLRVRSGRKTRESYDQTRRQEEGPREVFHLACLDGRKIISRATLELRRRVQPRPQFAPVAVGTRKNWFLDALHGGAAARACPNSAQMKN